MPDAKLIGLDWGTTSCRAYLIGADGTVLDRQLDGPGILKVENGHFGPWLDSMIGGWTAAHGPAPLILSGMIGSRQGWKEAPYATCPAGADDIVKALARIEWGELTIALVPGLSTENDGMPDVMRGEETQILGALALSGTDAGLFLLPGTHSKWATVSGGRIVSFRTFMTGEVFGAFKDHTILGRLMSGSAADADAFARGVREGASLESAGALLNRVFATRTYGLMDKLPATALADYLSGLADRRRSRRGNAANDKRRDDHRQPRACAALHRCAHAARPRQRARAGRLRRGGPLAHCARRRSVLRRRHARSARRTCRMPIAAILRGVKPDEIDAIGDALIEAGITVIEVPLNSPQPFESIKRLAARHGARALIGAGTVLEAADVARVKDAGGKLIVAPNFDADVVRAAKAAGLADAARRDDAVGRFRGAEGGSRRTEAVSRRDHPARGVQGVARGVPGRHADARGRRRRRGQSEDLRGGRCVRLRHRLGALQAGPPGGRNRQARQGAWLRPQRLDFSAFLAYISASRTEASRPALVSRGRFIAFGAAQAVRR